MDEMQYQLDLLSAMNEKLRGTEKMYQMICDASADAFLYCGFSGSQYEMVGNFHKMFDFEVRQERDLQRFLDSVRENQRNALRDVLFLEQSMQEKAFLECFMTEEKRWMRFETTIAYDDVARPLTKVIRISDIHKYKTQSEELNYMAYYDALTGLFNRNYFVSRLNEWIEKANKENALISVMCIDIDNFKKYNDGYGMVIGDEIIQNFGFYLKEFQKDNIIVTHASNDVYYIAIYDPFGKDTPESIYDLMKERTKAGFVMMNQKKLSFTVSVGVANYPEAGESAVDLMNSSEIMVFRAKDSGRENICYFEAPILSDFMDNFNMESKLKRALENEEFELYFQPQYDANDMSLRGVEALLRWHGENGEIINPSSFIPVAEQTGLIIPIGEWVIEEGIRLYTQWKSQYDKHLILSLNVSAIQYKQSGFIPHLVQTMNKYHVEPNDIELEITESVLIDDFREMRDKLLALRKYGIKISLDDFGTGYSSLSYLKGLPIDTLKIDKTFIDTVLEDESTQVITESIVSMVKKLGYETVAEGVENKKQFEYLKEINCDNIQGYLLGRPMAAEQLEKLLLERDKSNDRQSE